MVPINIGNHPVGLGQACMIVAEAGVNHNGSLETALRLVDAAVAAGADVVKFQTFKVEAVMTRTAPKATYQKKATGTNESQWEMIKRLQLTYEEFMKIKVYCDRKQILFLSTPFDHDSVDYLDDLGIPAFKISSGEITNDPLLRHIAAKGKPLILSTGMSRLDEVNRALKVIYSVGNRSVILLHCVSNYPADPADVNLRAMQTMSDVFAVPVGYSDHTKGIEISLAAVALGACVIEKHFTLNRAMTGPDHRASISPRELKSLVKSIRRVESSLGNGEKNPAPSEINTAEVARRSLVAACDIPLGAILEKKHVAIKRPGTGLPPLFIKKLIGRKVKVFVAADTMLNMDLFE